MRKIYFSFCKTISLFFALSFLSTTTLLAQTTLTTGPFPPYTGTNSLGAGGQIAFVIENTNAFPILLTGVGNYATTADNNSVWRLFYTATELSGSTTNCESGAWSLIATSSATTVTASGITPINFPSLSFTIPANTQYRFALENSGPGSIRYTGTGTACPNLSPEINVFAGNGVNLKNGCAQIAGQNIGWSGAGIALDANTPRYFTGSITFQPALPCTSPPTAGTATALPSTPVCLGTLVQLGLSGNSIGTGQTYVWQSSSSAGGPYADISSSSGSSSHTVTASTTTWYRAAVTCSGNTQYSTPVQVVVNPAFPGGTYTINSALPTSGSNFQTFTAAVNALSCGISGPVIFNVAAGSGPYNEQITIPSIGGSSAINTITFNGNGRTLSFNSTTTTARAGVTLNGANYITFDNLVIDGSAGTYGWGFLLTGAANQNTISNCTINISQTNTTAGNHAGIVMSGSTSSATTSGNNANNNTITGNTINGGYYGIICYGNSTAGAQNTNNLISGNIVQNVYAYSIYVIYQSGAIVRSNNISRPTRASSLSGAAGVYVTTGNINTLVEKNRIHNMFDAMATSTSTLYCVYASADGTAGQENKFINNLIYNIGGNGILYGIYNTAAPYMQAYHNTIAINDQAATTGTAYGFYQTGAATNIDFRNNIVTVTRSGTGTKRCIYFVTTTSTITSNKNVLYMNAAAGTGNFLGQFGTTNYATLANWQTANSNAYDQQSISVDPLYVNPVGGDYTPGAAAINNIGDNVGVTTDILNNPRTVATPDPGAYEVGPVLGCTDPPIPGTVTSSANPACSGTNFTLGLTGGTAGTGQTYQWQSSADNTVWTDIPGATNNSLTTSQTSDTYYRVKVTCGSGTATSASLLVTNQLCYCTSIPTSGIDTEVWGVSLNGSTNTSDCVTPAPGPGSILNRYSNFYPNGALTSVLPGLTVPFSVVIDDCTPSTFYNSGCAIWIDFNRDGDFDDAGEQVYVDNATSPAPRTITGTIAIPSGATPGITGMRVIVAETFSGSGLQPCMTYTYGETEDYLIDIISPVPCAGAPAGGSATSSTAVACTGQNFTLSATGATIALGITYQWQSSPDNINWTNIPGATNLSLITNQTSSNYYRLVVTCTNSSSSSNSTSVQVLTPSLVSGTFTINNALPTGGGNFNSFNDAYNYIKCGINGPVIFNVNAASGPYTEQLIINAVPGASATNTITFNGNGRIIQFLSTNTNERAVIKLAGANYFIFDSLTINATANSTTDYGFGVQLIGDADSNIVRNCAINITSGQTSTNHAGIVISASATSATATGNTMSDDNLFEENIITGGYYGVTNVGSSTVANQRNKFIRNTVKDYYLYGFYTNGTFQTQIDGNDISRPARSNLSTGTSYAIYFTGLSTSAKVNGNYIHGLLDANTTSANDVYGIYFTGVDALSGLDNVVTNNLIYDIKSNGTIYGIYNASSDNVLYYHNTISLDDAASTSTEDTRGFYQTTAAAGIVFRNNIITLRRGGTGSRHGIYFNTPASSIISNNNDVFFNPLPDFFFGYNGNDQAILADWQAATGQDANSVSNDPLYINPATGNYKPNNAVIDNLGAPLGITLDILGLSRSATTPDIGAYEFVPPPCTTPPTPGTATVSSTPVCENTLVALGVTGFSIGGGQTYQWQSSVNLAGPYTNISAVLNTPSLTISATETLYYRIAITCGGNTQYSTPVLLSVNPGLPGGTYTIDPSEPASGTNFISFNAAKDAMACGITGPVVFNVEPASPVFNEQLLLDSIPGTSNINTITFNCTGNTIRFGSANTNERAVIRLSGTDYVTFNDLIIDSDAGGTYGWGVWLTNNADNNTFNNCTIKSNATSTSTNYAGVVIAGSATAATSTTASYCDGNQFINNTIIGGYYGMTMMSSSAVLISSNKFINNQVREFYSYGIYIGNTIDAIVEKNLITRPTRTAVSTHYGIYGGGTTNTNVLVSKNKITSPFGGNTASTSTIYGIYFASDAAAGQEAKVVNNLLYNFDGAGPIYALYNTTANNIGYYHNTVSLDNTGNTSTNLSRGFYQTGTSAGITLKNNIISITRGGTGAKHCLYFGTTGSTIVSNRNDLYVNPATGTSGVGFYSTNQATLANWQSASSQDANSVSLDPQYTDPANGNFTPQQALIDNIGEPLGITTDINDAPRSLTTPDIGAIEFAITPCTVPPVPGTSTVNPSSGICLGTFITLNLTGNSTGGFQQYIWQFGPSATGPWQNISDTLYSPQYLYELSSYTNTWFRAMVKCGNGITYSVPVQVNINPALLAGDYTINPANPPSATNFQSFATAVAALQCGIAGSVRFHAVTGIYNEQIIIKKVPGASATSTVTFMSQNGNPASVNLTYNSTITALNYVLKLDSASFITFKNISITATNTANGRAIEFANNASKDSILNCMIDVPPSSSTTNVIAGIFGTALSGTDIVVKGNTITDGSSNIYLSGTAGAANRFVVDSNNLNGAYYYSSYTGGINNVRVTKNTVTRSGILNTTAYGIYLTNCDSIYVVDDNKVTIENAGTTNYAIYLTGCAANPLQPGSVSRNKITAVNNVTSATLYGLYQTGSVSNYTVNNIIDVNSTGATVRGLYSSTGGGMKYYNNTVRNSSPSTANTNVAAYFSQTTGTSGITNIRNNIFYQAGGGVALYQGNVANIYSDYNMYYTNGTTLILQGTNAYPTLQAWKTAENWDYNSIVYTPAFVTGTTLQPDVNNANVWAMHGRGVQITDNPSDINGNPRPTTLTTGVPDLGAYEFLPAVTPPVLPGTPAAPAANTTQYFMFGTDTVQKVTWGGTVPANVEVRRYSGVIPPNLAAGQQSMYFYTDVDITGSTPSSYTLKQFYIDPWMRNIPSEPTVKMGRTNAANNWIVSSASTVDVFNNVITESGLSFMDKFTGMTDGQAPAPPIPPGFTTDTSNKGRRFWVGYGHHYGFSTNGQTMVLYLSAEQAANVTVKVNGTGWVRNYVIPANTVTVSDPMPESGLIDSRILDEGLSNNGISIESDVPIVAYAHIFQGANSGATMLLPVGTYGYEYRSLNATQYYPTGGAGSYSWFYVIADRDSTLVEITPSVATKSGRPAGIAFQVYLMRGQVYNVMGTQPTAAGTDISGSTIKSIPNASGKCFPIAVFSGSSRTALCNTTNGDNFIQQAFPASAWGTKYLTFATANSASNTLYYSNKWRVMVKDPATVVRRNGVILNPATLVTPGNYYEIGITAGSGASTASYFEADQPIMVAQYMLSSDGTGCAGLAAPGGDGDPEMIYISPIEQGIKRAVFYTTNQSAINSNYINVIVPTTGLATLTIDGSSTFTDVFAHPNLAGYTCIRQNLGGTAGQHIIQCDSAFTAITYGLGSVESYGYNAGTLVKNLSVTPAFNNVFNSGTTSTYTCKGTPFNLRIQISVKPTQLIWNLSQVPNISPNVDVVQNNPVPTDSVIINSKKFYIYQLPQSYTFNAVGSYLIPITVFHPSIEGCGGSIEITLPVSVIAAPVSDFTVSAPNCIGEPVQFNATTTTSNGVPVNQWTWNFGDNTNGTGQNPIHTYATAGTFSVALRGIANDGCVGDTTKALVINAKPIPAIVQDTVYVCNNASATFTVQNPVTGATYNWYNAATAGTLLGTGNTVTVNNVTGFVNVYLEAIVGGCISVTRDRATAAILPTLAIPTVIVDSIGVNMLRFRWNAIPNATGYQVTTNGGTTWVTPSSGPTGLTHTITGLTLGAQVTLQVRALGGCLPALSAAVTGQTRTDQVYIPNSFTPNGDGRNDVLRVYSNVIRSMRILIFNQWGEKVYESTDQNMAWDGTYRNKPQPSGVYIYVAEIIINTGEKLERKGAINLVR